MTIDDIKAMTDTDELRKAVGDIEREIKSMAIDDPDMPEYDPTRILINGNAIEVPTGERGEKLKRLLGLRREALNQMFRATDDEMAQFVKVNDYLTNQTKKLTKRTANLYRSIMTIGRVLGFDDKLEVLGTMDICRHYPTPLPFDDYYGSDFWYMTELIRQINYGFIDDSMLSCTIRANNDNTLDKDDDELIEMDTHCVFIFDRDSIFDKGKWAEAFDDIEICEATRELCNPKGFSIPDFLHVVEVVSKSEVECYHDSQVLETTNLLVEFEKNIEKRDYASMIYHLIKVGNAEDVYSVKLPVVNSQVYLYATNSEAALMMVDNYTEEMEIADEKPFRDDPPLYFTEQGHRRSPVQFLCSIAKELKEIPALKDVKIGCFLLTTSNISNCDAMKGVWKKMDVTVRANLGHRINNSITTQHEEAITYFSDISEFVNRMRVYVMAVKQNERKTDSDTTDESESLEESFVNLLKEFTEVTSHEDDSADDSSSDDDSADDSSSDEDSADDSSSDEDSADDLLDDDDDAPSGLETGAWLDDNDDSAPSSLGSNSDIHNEPPQARVLNYIKDARQQLDALVGLDDIKQHIKDMLNLSQFNLKKWNYDPQAKLHDVNLHSIFCGPVGVGKTTVAQLYSSLLHDAGVLSKGHVVICDRGTFIGRLWGDEERRVAKVLDMARGGVLFIDEAYLLSTSNPNDPGRIVLPSMLNLLADESQRDIAVVLAGYDKPMENLLSINPGLASRFVNRFHFKPFTVDELMEITTRKNAPYHYTFSDEALAAYRKLMEKAHKTKGSTFGNGRFVANLLEKIYIRHASRCMDNNLADKDLMIITAEDIPTEYTTEDEERRMGFR